MMLHTDCAMWCPLSFFTRHVYKIRCNEGFIFRLRPFILKEGMEVRARR